MCPWHFRDVGYPESTITVELVVEKQTPLPGVDA
jgi:hypothetical protein